MRKRKIWLLITLILSGLFAFSANLSAAAASNPPAPTLSYYPTAPTNGNVAVTVYYPANTLLKQYKLGSNGTWMAYISPVVLTSNAYVYIRYQSISGAWSDLGGFWISNIDKTPPMSPVFTPSITTPTNQNVTVSVTFSSDSMVKQYMIGGSSWTSYIAPVVLSSNNTVYAKSSDSAGNWTLASSISVINIDKTPPSDPTFTESTTQSTNQDVTLSINYSSDSAVKQYKAGDTGIWTNYLGPITIGSNSTVYAKASDNAGNSTAVTSYSVSNIDKTAPNAPTFSASTAAPTDQPVTLTINYSSDSIAKRYRLGTDGTWMNYTDPIVLTSNNTVYANSSDAVGNVSTDASYSVSDITKTVLGYTVKVTGTDTSCYNSITANTSTLNEIATATFSVDGSGNLLGAAPLDQVNYANGSGIRTKLMVSNNYDASISKQLLESPANRQNLKANILSLLKTYNYYGVDMDVENIPASDRDYLTLLMNEIYSTLKPLGYGVSVAVAAKVNDSPNATWNYGFDYKSLAASSDYLMLMTYDEHYPGGTAGSIASIGWVTSVVDYALTVVPKEKLVLGMPAYGYDWVGTATKAYSINGCLSLASQYGAAVNFDSVTKSKYFTYTTNGITHSVWFEDSDCISYLLDLANSRNLKGVGIWKLGLENANYWSVIKSKLGK